jgi:flagellar motor switch protein FliG
MAATAMVQRKSGGQAGPAELTGRQKVAVLLMALGEEASSEITKHLNPDEVEAISFEIARMDRVDAATVEAVLNEWQHTEVAALSLASGGVDYARRVLEKALGQQKAAIILRRIENQLKDHISFNHLRTADPQQLSAVIRGEHPQTIALVMAYLDPAQTAAMLKEMDPEAGSDVILRMARMEKVLPDVLRIIEGTVGADSDLSLSGKGSSAGGPAAVAEVLNLIPGAREKELLEGVARTHPELSEAIKNLMFVFDDIRKLDDRAVTRVLRDVDTRQLATALKVAGDELKERLLGALSTRARDSLLQEMEFLGPVRVSDVEAAQAEVVALVRALEEAGEIVVSGGDDDVVA